MSSDPTLLRLWHRPAATAPIRPLSWEPPHATGVALEIAKRQKKKKKKKIVCLPSRLIFLINRVLTWFFQGKRNGFKEEKNTQ